MIKLLAKEQNLININLYSKTTSGSGEASSQSPLGPKGLFHHQCTLLLYSLHQNRHFSSFHLDHYKYHLVKRRKKFLRRSDYLLRLKERKKLAYLYGNLSSAYIKKTAQQAAKQKGTMMKNLLILLEARLDVILCRICFFKTIPQARQYISHGLILVNGFKVDIPSAKIKPGDVISVVPDQVKKLQAQMCTYLKSPNFFGRKEPQPLASLASKLKGTLVKKAPLPHLKRGHEYISRGDPVKQRRASALSAGGAFSAWRSGPKAHKAAHYVRATRPSGETMFNLQSAANAWIKYLALQANVVKGRLGPVNAEGRFHDKQVARAFDLKIVAAPRYPEQSLMGKTKAKKAPFGAMSNSKQIAFAKHKIVLKRQYKYYTIGAQRRDMIGLAERLPGSFRQWAFETRQTPVPVTELPLAALKIKQYSLILSAKTKQRLLRRRSLSISSMKPLNLEVSYRLLTAIYLYSPQKVAFPALLDLDLVVRSLR